MKNHGRIWLILTVLCLTAVSTYGQELRIIELKHRRADEVIRIVRPQLGPEDSISGKGTVVILSAAPEHITRIESIIRTLDKPSRQLLITVVQGENARQALDSIDVSGNVSIGDDARIEFGRRPQPDDTVSVEGRSGRSAQRNADIQQLRVQEGMAASIFIGQSIPISAQAAAPRTQHRQPGQDVVFREVRTGFRVVPRLTGNRFVLDIASQRETSDTIAYGAVASQQIQTQVYGKLGQWVDIGGIVGQRQFSESGILYSDDNRRRNDQAVYIRIVEIKP